MNSSKPLAIRKQKTLLRPVSYSGIGIHSGKEAQMRFCPAKEGSGVYFKRLDIQGQPIIPATVEYVFDTSRSTNIGIKDVRIFTVEHVLAALQAYDIDNLCIELNSIEPPAGDGSSAVFIDLIESAGVVEQSADISIAQLRHPIAFSQGEIHIVALPSEEYRISYTLSYEDSPAIRCQYCSMQINQENFKKNIGSCRTFARYEELSYLIDNGLIKGASLDNAIVIKDNAVISRDGIRFPDEMARHKILDAVGDLKLVGIPFAAHIIAIRSGHAANFELAKLLFKHISLENKNVN